MNQPTRYVTNSVVSCGDEEDGSMLFNPDTNDTTVINCTGRELWTFLETPRTVHEIATHLVETYTGVTIEQATEDASQFIQSLTPGFLLEIDDET